MKAQVSKIIFLSFLTLLFSISSVSAMPPNPIGSSREYGTPDSIAKVVQARFKRDLEIAKLREENRKNAEKEREQLKQEKEKEAKQREKDREKRQKEIEKERQKAEKEKEKEIAKAKEAESGGRRGIFTRKKEEAPSADGLTRPKKKLKKSFWSVSYTHLTLPTICSV